MPPPPIQPAQYQTVPLSLIDLQQDEFRITTCQDLYDLETSIRQVGLIGPPLLVKKTRQFAIVSGFRRVEACRNLGWHEISVGVLDPQMDHLDCLRLAIADNALQRPLNLIETSRALHKLSAFSESLEELADSASTCGLTSNHVVIEKTKDLCLLPQSIQYSILNETISLTMANELARLDPDAAVEFAQLFEQLKLSLNKQRELIRLVSEIARREDISIRQVLAMDPLQHILADKNFDRGQKGRKIRSFLRQRRFPRIVAAEQKYVAHLKKLKLDPAIKLIPPKDFEGDSFSLNLTFTSLDQLKSLSPMLDDIIQHPSFKKIVHE